MGLTAALAALGVGSDRPLEELTLPMVLIDGTRRVRWQNEALRRLVGERRGSSYAQFIAPDHRNRSLERFAAIMFGAEAPSHVDSVLIDAQGRRARVAVAITPIRDPNERVVGILGVVKEVALEHEPRLPDPALTPRLLETLQLLAAGLSTTELAAELGVTIETTRNYVRRLLRALDVHSRVEAVARGRELGVLERYSVVRRR
jgi:PAS domain S-box-containing protein